MIIYTKQYETWSTALRGPWLKAEALYLADCTSQALEAMSEAETSPKRAAPRHPEFVEAGKTAWRFLNCVTEIAKDGGLWSLPPHGSPPWSP
jgi:hypothetical protein